jgi:hypothetical protein
MILTPLAITQAPAATAHDLRDQLIALADRASLASHQDTAQHLAWDALAQQLSAAIALCNAIERSAK